MRDIKFRAWNGSRMGGGGYCDFELHGGAIFEWDSTGYEIHKKNYPLMQNTGLKDKNGAEIYEGDIAIVPYAIISGVVMISEEVVFENGGFDHTTKNMPENTLEWPVINSNPEEFEVIGNIHETPGLLTKLYGATT